VQQIVCVDVVVGKVCWGELIGSREARTAAIGSECPVDEVVEVVGETCFPLVGVDELLPRPLVVILSLLSVEGPGLGGGVFVQGNM
jgi:hypothetical protein